MSRTERYHTRADISTDDLSPEREQELRSAFETAEYGERIQQCVAATFEVDQPIEKSGIVVSSRLHHEHIFDMVGSYGSGKDQGTEQIIASARVLDVETQDKLAAHVSQTRVLVSLRDEDVSFESFAAYILFLEQTLHAELSPILE